MKEFRIVYGPKTYLGSQTPITEYEKKVTPSMSIVALTDSGLSMVYQAHDGSFVIIDGGYGTDTIASYTINKGTSTEMTLTYNRDVKTDMESLWKLLEETASFFSGRRATPGIISSGWSERTATPCPGMYTQGKEADIRRPASTAACTWSGVSARATVQSIARMIIRDSSFAEKILFTLI